MMQITDEDFDAIITALDLFYHPAKYGCAISTTDKAAYEKAVEDLSAAAAAVLSRLAAARVRAMSTAEIEARLKAGDGCKSSHRDGTRRQAERRSLH